MAQNATSAATRNRPSVPAAVIRPTPNPVLGPERPPPPPLPFFGTRDLGMRTLGVRRDGALAKSVDLLEDHRGVGAAEAEAVGHGDIDLPGLALVRDQVDRRLHLRIVQIYGRRRHLIADGQDR